MKIKFSLLILFIPIFFSCGKKSNPNPNPPATPKNFLFKNSEVSLSSEPANTYKGVGINETISLFFNVPVKRSSIASGILLYEKGGGSVLFTSRFGNGDSSVIIDPAVPLNYLSTYNLSIGTALTSSENVQLKNTHNVIITTAIDSSDKFPRISDEELLTKIQSQTFKYFWDFGHPVSGMARERNTSPDMVTTGGTGFGVMSILVGIERNFITRSEGFARIDKIVTFLTNKSIRYHGAFSHWINGNTGATIPFSQKDNGGDLVETSLLMQGLLSARQYFDGLGAEEISLRTKINALWEGVEWDWYTNGDNVLYWHWSPDYQFEIKLPIRGWNEALIVYALAASSPTHPIDKVAYDEGWAGGSNFRNGSSYYGITLPLGPPLGGPLFFAHYSFLGIDPNGLSDAYANYWSQNTAHSRINYEYCKDNPKDFFGYSEVCWGLTASDDNDQGYMAHSPMNDNGVISPTAAVSSIPYTPEASIKALKFFYYVLGDKLFGEYGFKDAFSLNDLWFADSYLAIDQGPQIVMIENYRSGLLWNLFMSCPEVKTGMKSLGFQSPNL